MEIITIKDIAKALNISTSTVSRALRDSYEINPETKKLVLDYAEKVNYEPNPIALSLKENKSKSIGVIVPQIANTFFSQVINGIESIAYLLGYQVVIFQTGELYEREVANTKQLVSRRVDGLLVSMSSMTEDESHFEQLIVKGMPIVFFDRVPKTIDAYKITSDNYNGAYKATAHLIANGFRQIAHVTSHEGLSITQERLSGYKAALADHGLTFQPHFIQYCQHGGAIADEMELAMNRIFAAGIIPDAIFAASDRLTFSCLYGLKKRGYKVPGDVGLVGFTNLPMVDLMDPPLTTVTQPAIEMGNIACEWLIDLIEHPTRMVQYETRNLPVSLSLRESSQPRAAR